MSKKEIPPQDPFDGLPPWLAEMRRAAVAAVKPADITAMVEAQVEKAKKGDRDALKFVFEQVLGGAQLRGSTFIQNNYQSDIQPDKPTKALPGSKEKLEVIRQRIASGNGAFHPKDGADDEDLE